MNYTGASNIYGGMMVGAMMLLENITDRGLLYKWGMTKKDHRPRKRGKKNQRKGVA